MGYTLDEVAELAGVNPRTVRHWIKQNLLAAPEFRGTRTRYSDDFLLRLQAIRRMREKNLRLGDVRRRLSRASPADVARLAGREPAPAPPAAASASVSGLPHAAERWDRIVLLPGLEIHVRADAGLVLRRLAGEIHAAYGAQAGGTAVLGDVAGQS